MGGKPNAKRTSVLRKHHDPLHLLPNLVRRLASLLGGRMTRTARLCIILTAMALALGATFLIAGHDLCGGRCTGISGLAWLSGAAMGFAAGWAVCLIVNRRFFV